MLIQQVVDAIANAQKGGFKVLTFVVPVSPEALENCGRSVSEVEEIAEAALIKAVKEALVPKKRVGAYFICPDHGEVYMQPGMPRMMTLDYRKIIPLREDVPPIAAFDQPRCPIEGCGKWFEFKSVYK